LSEKVSKFKKEKSTDIRAVRKIESTVTTAARVCE
jgi:hypothetical protein